jgi:hypothetical protein
MTGTRQHQLGQAYLEQRIVEEVSTVIEGVLKAIEDANRQKIAVADVESTISRAMLHMQRRHYEKALKSALHAQAILRERMEGPQKETPPPPPPTVVPPPPGGER